MGNLLQLDGYELAVAVNSPPETSHANPAYPHPRFHVHRL